MRPPWRKSFSDLALDKKPKKAAPAATRRLIAAQGKS
jgi:hypothetical protein